MPRFVIRMAEEVSQWACALCGREIAQRSGLVLGLADSKAVVCRECGKAHAPQLRALLDLAQVAEKVGRVSQYGRLWVPLELLLEMTRVSQDYFQFAAREDESP